MAISDIKVRKKKKRFKNSMQVDEKYLGPEPTNIDFTLEKDDVKLLRAFNWYNYFFTVKEGRKWLEEYIADTRGKDVLKKFRQVNDNHIKTTPCWIAKMLIDQEITFKSETLKYMEERIDYALSKAGAKEEVVEEAPAAPTVKASPFVRTMNKAKSLMTNLEEEIDKAIENNFETDFSMYTFIQADSNPQFIVMATEYIQSTLEELKNYPEGFDQNLYKKQLKFFTDMYEDLTRQKENKKVLRKPRAKKEIPVEKLLKNFKYCEKNDPLKLVSIQPQNIIGAQQLWFYNARYNTIGVMNAADERGLQINGSSITGFNPETSAVKKCRKPEEALKEFFEQGKIGLRKFLLTLKTTQYSINSGRSTSDMVFLKAIK